MISWWWISSRNRCRWCSSRIRWFSSWKECWMIYIILSCRMSSVRNKLIWMHIRFKSRTTKMDSNMLRWLEKRCRNKSKCCKNCRRLKFNKTRCSWSWWTSLNRTAGNLATKILVLVKWVHWNLYRNHIVARLMRKRMRVPLIWLSIDSSSYVGTKITNWMKVILTRSLFYNRMYLTLVLRRRRRRSGWILKLYWWMEIRIRRLERWKYVLVLRILKGKAIYQNDLLLTIILSKLISLLSRIRWLKVIVIIKVDVVWWERKKWWVIRIDCKTKCICYWIRKKRRWSWIWLKVNRI